MQFVYEDLWLVLPCSTLDFEVWITRLWQKKVKKSEVWTSKSPVRSLLLTYTVQLISNMDSWRQVQVQYFRCSEEAGNPYGRAYFCLCMCVLWCWGDQGFRWKKNYKKPNWKQEGSKQTKIVFPSFFTTLHHFLPLLPLPTVYRLSCVATLQTIFAPCQVSQETSWEESAGRVYVCIMCTLQCVCDGSSCVRVRGTALWVRNSRICPESSFILRHVSS